MSDASARWDRRTEYVRGFETATDTDDVNEDILANLDGIERLEQELREAGIKVPASN